MTEAAEGRAEAGQILRGRAGAEQGRAGQRQVGVRAETRQGQER